MDEQYKIQLGVEVDVDDIQSQINRADVKPVQIKVEIENLNEIKQQLQNLGGTKGNKKVAIPIDTASVESALHEVSSAIKEIKTSIGTLDSKSGMKSLLSSINQISNALDKASDKFVELNANLNALASKDFNINFGINMGGSNPIARNTAYGQKIRGETLPELQKQVKAFEDYFSKYYKGKYREGSSPLSNLLTGSNAWQKHNTNAWDLNLQMADDSNLSKQINAYKQYISVIKEAAALKGIDISHITSQFSKSADALVQDAVDIQTGANEMEEGFEKLKQIFGGSNNFNVEGLSDQLDSIVVDLGEIKTALQDLSAGISLDGLSQSFDRLSTSIETLVQNCGNARTAINNAVGNANAGNTGGGVADDVNRNAEELKTAYNKLKNISKNIGSIKIKLSDGLDSSKDIQQIQVLERQLQSLTAEYHKTVSKIKDKGDLSSTQWQSIQQQIDNTKIKLEQLEAELADTKAKLANKIQIDLESGKFATQVDKVHSNAKKLSNVSDELRTKLDMLDDAERAMNASFENGGVEDKIAAYKNYEAALESVKNQLEQNKIAEQNALNTTALKQSRDKLSLDMDNWLKENSAAAQQFGGRIRELQAQINNCDKTSLARLRAEFTNIKKEAQLAGKTTQTFGDKLKAQFSKYSSYFSVASLFIYASQGLRDMFNQVVAIDSAMTELKKVTNETDESYNKFLTNAASRSKELGTTIDGLVASTADFARLGYGFEDSQGLAEVANIYAVVGDEINGVEDATKSLISTLAAYKDEASGVSDTDFAMDIVDKFNEVSNNFAISSGGIGEAMQRSASSLRAANNTIDESIALITAANTVVQDPVTIGTSFKTISMRIRGAKSELEEAGLETEGMVESTAKLREEIMALSGVDIMLDENNFKSTYQIMDELAQKWEDLSDIQQASITELIAGKRQGNVVSSLMQNFDIARDALETSLNSSGSAMEEHEKWQKSLEAQINKLKASWQSLSQAFLSSDFLHGAFDAVIKLVDGLTLLIDKVGVLPTLLVAFSAYKSFSGGGFFKPIINEATGVATGITNVFKQAAAESTAALQSIGLKGSSAFKDGLKTDIAAFGNYRKAIREGMSETEAQSRYLNTASAAFQDYAKSGKLAANGVSGFIKQQQLAEVSVQAQNKSLSSANAIIKEYYSGCKNVGVGQNDFLNAVKQTNPELANSISNSKNAAGAMAGYTKTLVGAKAASTALKVASMALNAALSYGIGILISYAVQGIMKVVNASDELAEKVEELTSKYKEQHEELKKLQGNYDTSNESSMISKYEKLSKGVDHLGRNVSLTADEYSEYQSIVNKIAEQIPSLVSGYDAQGNALLSCKGNVEELTEAYEKLIHAQNTSILQNGGDIEKNYKKSFKKDKQGFFERNFERAFPWISSWFGAYDSLSAETVKELEKFYSGDIDVDKLMYNLNDGQHSELTEALKREGYTFSLDTHVRDVLEQNPDSVKRIIDDYYSQFDEVVEESKSIAKAKLSEAFDVNSAISGLDYGNISEDLQVVAYQVVNSLDKNFFDALTEEGTRVEDWVTNMLDQLNSIDSRKSEKISAAFDLQTQFNGGEISYGEYVKGLEDTGKLIDGLDLDPQIESQLKLSIGLDEDGLVAEYQKLRNRLASNEYFDIMPSDYVPFIENLSSEELSVLWRVIPELEATDYKEDIADIKSALELEMMLQGLNFDLNIEVEAAGLEALNTALAESVSATGLSSESIDALKGRYADLESQGYDLSSMFEETSTGIRLNRQEFNKLENAYATEKLAEVDGELTEMKSTYDDLGEAIKNCDDPVRKSELFNDRQTLAKRISEAATLAHQYKGLTNAYNDWLSAEEAGQERDMYENVIKGFETIDDEISRGWIDDSAIEFLELLTGRTDLAGKSGKQLKEIYDSLDGTIKNTTYSVRDFFTVDEDGNSTNAGVYNFLDAIGQLEEEKFGGKDIVKRDKDGNIISFDFELAGGDEVIAEALGVSEELVQIMVRAADDAGFVVSMDGTYRQLADLQNEAKAAADYLHEIGKTDFEFDFNTTSVKDLKDQLVEAHEILDSKEFWNKDGTFNFNADGATQAMQVVSTLQAKLDKLTEEDYGIGLTVEDEEFEEPLENLQEYGRTIQTLNQLKLNKVANADEIKELEGDLKEIARYFADLDGETKVKLGFDADDDWKEVQKKIESGEVTIPTVLDIQANMDKNIETLADLALLNSGLLSTEEEEVIEKKYKIDTEVKSGNSYVDPNVEWVLTAEEQTRQQNVEIIAKTFGIEDVGDLSTKLKGLDDKTVQAIVEAVGKIKVEELRQELAKLEPTKVQAIVEAIGKGDVEGLKTAINQLSPKQVDAIAKALGYDDVKDLNYAIEDMDGNTVQAVAEALGITDVESLQSAIDNMHGNTVDTKVNTDGQAEKVWSLQRVIDGLKGTAVNITLGIKKAASSLWGYVTGNKGSTRNDSNGYNDSRGSRVNGTANVNGTTGRAFKQGSLGTKNSGTALVGELGTEVLVRDGRYYTIGDNGAEFIKYKKGDIVFNHRQTEELFANGKVTSGGGRGKAFADGTAFLSGSGGIGKVVTPVVKDGSSKKTTTTKTTTKSTPESTTTTTTTTTSSGSSGSIGGTGEAEGSAVGEKDKFEETFDWVAIAIERIEREIDNLDKIVGSTYQSWSKRNGALTDELEKIAEERQLQIKAYREYMYEANNISLDASLKEKVRNGTIDVETITDESVAEKVKEYQEW